MKRRAMCDEGACRDFWDPSEVSTTTRKMDDGQLDGGVMYAQAKAIDVRCELGDRYM
jgi:hypothetical protein